MKEEKRYPGPPKWESGSRWEWDARQPKLVLNASYRPGPVLGTGDPGLRNNLTPAPRSPGSGAEIKCQLVPVELGSAPCTQHWVGLRGVSRIILGAWQRATGVQPAWAVKGRGHTRWRRRPTPGSGAPCFSGTQPCQFQLCFGSCPNPASVSPPC